MKLIVIGSSSAYPTENNPTAGYLVESEDGTKVLLDIGSGVLMKLKSVTSFNDIDNIYISHMHFDHSADAGVAIYDRIVNKDLGEVERNITFYTPSNPKAEVLNSIASSVKFIDSDSVVEIGSLRFTFLKVDHDENCHAVKVEEGDRTLVYTADTRYFPELVDFAGGCNLLLAECSMERKYDARKFGHMNTEDVAGLASEVRPDILALCHTPGYTTEEQILSEVSENYDGLTFYARAKDVFEI